MVGKFFNRLRKWYQNRWHRFWDWAWRFLRQGIRFLWTWFFHMKNGAFSGWNLFQWTWRKFSFTHPHQLEALHLIIMNRVIREGFRLLILHRLPFSPLVLTWPKSLRLIRKWGSCFKCTGKFLVLKLLIQLRQDCMYWGHRWWHQNSIRRHGRIGLCRFRWLFGHLQGLNCIFIKVFTYQQLKYLWFDWDFKGVRLSFLIGWQVHDRDGC